MSGVTPIRDPDTTPCLPRRTPSWLPVVLSTVHVKHGMSGTNKELLEALPGVQEIDRTTLNSWA
mgnify:CR=1 FL=1